MDTQQKVYQIWSDILGKSELSLEKSFFELGGDSILIMKAQARLEKTFSCEISIPDFFAYPSISKLAEFIDNTKN